jgi:hypothetical protein
MFGQPMIALCVADGWAFHEYSSDCTSNEPDKWVGNYTYFTC